MCGVEHPQEILDRIGKYKTGKSCFYINKLSDINNDVLIELIKSVVAEMDRLYPQ